MKRRRQREYQCHGRTEKYLEIKSKFDEKLKYIEKIKNEVSEGKRGSSYPAIKKLGLRPFEKIQESFLLPSHVEQNLTPAQSAEVIADHFSSISQEYSPLNPQNFPPNIQNHLSNPDQVMAPKLTRYDVYRKIVKAKKPNSQVHGDIPKKLVQNFANNLAFPVAENTTT